MKYVRTSKEILYLVSEPIYGDDGVCIQDCYECITSKGKTNYIFSFDIIKKAYNIEELCDYVFFKDWEGKLQIQKMFGGNEQIKHLSLNGATEIKLAILTNKGLIYAAELNKKGEIELL